MTHKAISPLRQRMIEDMSVRKFCEKASTIMCAMSSSSPRSSAARPRQPRARICARFQLHQTENGVQPPSFNSAAVALRFFFLVTLGRPDLAHQLTRINYPRKLPRILSPEDVARLLEAAPGPGLKYKAALSVAYGAGLRAAEVAMLRVSDIDSKRMLIRVEQGKGSKDRHAMLSPQLLEVLRAWWQQCRSKGWLFPGRDPILPMTTRQLNRACHMAADVGGPRHLDLAAYAQAQLCDASAGKPYRCARYSSASWAMRSWTRPRATLRLPPTCCTRYEPARPADAAEGQRQEAGNGQAPMARPSLEVADIFRSHGAAWRKANRGHVSLGQLKVMSAIENCRTAALGGHIERCENGACGHMAIAYNSCTNRHCPKCQGAAAREWLAAREAELLPVQYFHQVFTLPEAIADIAYQNKAVIYDLLFKASAETMLTIGADPKHLGARTGFISVLHTWGSAMTHHPHVHMIAPGGGLSPDGTRWIPCRRGFFLPVRVLSKLFRRLMLEKLAAAHKAGKLASLASMHTWPARMRSPPSWRRSKR